jgi:excinuclease ABC subunit A
VAEGFARVRINGEVRELADNIELDKNHAHNIEVVVDRLVAREGVAGAAHRLAAHGAQARRGPGPGGGGAQGRRAAARRLRARAAFRRTSPARSHGAVMEELSPRLFSFNSPYGACADCHGIGTLRRFDL